MSGFRDKFSGAKLSANKDVQKNAAENDKNLFGKSGSRVDFLEVNEGKNEFRILPPHPDDTIGAAYLPKRVAVLKCEVEVYDNGEPTGKTEIRNKNIFTATQHGGLPKDPVELYIDYVRKYADDTIQDKTDRQKFLSPITGWRDKKGTWNWGIAPKTSFVTYAIKAGKIGRLEMYESWVKDMNRLAITEDADEVMQVDPFSDPTEGFPLIITKKKAVDKTGKETGKWEYEITKDEPSRVKRESWTDFFKRTQVSDAQLEEFIKQEPLSKLYGKDVYTRRDWDLAIDGLRRFDSEYKFQIFENEEFMEELSGLEVLVPEVKEENSDKEVEKTFEKEEEKESKMEVSILEMKTELKRFITKQYGAEFIDQIPFSKLEVQKWYALLEEGETLPINITQPADRPTPPKMEEMKPKEAQVVDTAGSVDDQELNDQIAKLRARRNSGK